MGKSLYRSYRSKSFDEIIGQDHITATLKNALKNEAIAHAYLLSGPRGVGKTSIARILAYEVNKQPYDLENNSNLDIIEIDAASNRRIDEVREIREKVKIAPTNGKYKVYIIDEVHMLTKEAFNALLKTLEEPPAHAIFILATTESHKLPETIVSRCIHFNFKPIDVQIIKKHLENVAKKERINISSDALLLISEHSQGSFRDSLTLLEQVQYISEDIDINDVSLMLGLARQKNVDEIINSLEVGDIGKLHKSLLSSYEYGTEASVLASQLQRKFMDIVLSKTSTTLDDSDLIALQQKLLLVPGSQKPNIQLELTLASFLLEKSTNQRTVGDVTVATQATSKVTSRPLRTTDTKKYAPTIKNDTVELSQDNDFNKEFLNVLKTKNNTLYGVLRLANIVKIENEVKLIFKFAFHKKQIDDSKNKAIVTGILSKIYDQPIVVATELAEKTKNPVQKNTNLVNVSNIFGSSEVLES